MFFMGLVQMRFVFELEIYIYCFLMISNLSSKPFVVKRPKSKMGKTESDSSRSIHHFQKEKSPKKSLAKSPRSFNLPQSHSDLTKIIPKNIIYDKQTLYYEVRELKIALNKVMDENTKLKTRIAISSHNKQKINISAEYECIEEGYGYRVGYTKKQQSRNDLQSIKIIREMQELRHHHDKLQTQMKHMKKTIRFTQIQQLELQVKILMEENVNLYRKNQNLMKEVEQYQEIAQDYHCLKKILGEKSKENREYIQRIQDLSIQVMDLESSIKKLQQKNREKGGKEIREEKKTLSHDEHGQKDNIESVNMKGVDDKLRGSGYRTHHYHVQPMKTMRRQQFFSTKLAQKSQTPQFLPTPFQKIETLQSADPSPNKQVSQPPKVNAEDSNQRSIQKNIYVHNTTEDQTLIIENVEVEEVQNNEVQKDITGNEVLQEQIQGGADIKQKKTGSQNGNGNHFISQTDKIFQKISDSEVEDKQHRSQQHFGYSFMAHPQNSQSEPPNPFSVLPKTNLQKDTFAPNPKTLKEIKVFLTYRFMFQKYSFSSLKKDILGSSAKQFTYNDLCFMMVNEPFYLNVDYSLEIIKYILERGRPNHEDRVEKSCLIMKLGEIIGNFKDVSLLQQSQMFQKCCIIFNRHENVLRELFEAGKNSKNTISHAKLIDILSKCELNLSEIQFLIAQTSIYSQDLNHLNYQLLFDRFLQSSQEQQRREVIVERAEEQNQTLGKSNHEKVNFVQQQQKKSKEFNQGSPSPISNSQRIQERQQPSLPPLNSYDK